MKVITKVAFNAAFLLTYDSVFAVEEKNSVPDFLFPNVGLGLNAVDRGLSAWALNRINLSY